MRSPNYIHMHLWSMDLFYWLLRSKEVDFFFLTYFLAGLFPVCQWTWCRRCTSKKSGEVQGPPDQEVSVGFRCRPGRLCPRGGGAARRCYSRLKNICSSGGTSDTDGQRWTLVSKGRSKDSLKPSRKFNIGLRMYSAPSCKESKHVTKSSSVLQPRWSCCVLSVSDALWW